MADAGTILILRITLRAARALPSGCVVAGASAVVGASINICGMTRAVSGGRGKGGGGASMNNDEANTARTAAPVMVSSSSLAGS